MNIAEHMQSLLKELNQKSERAAANALLNTERNSKSKYKGRPIWTADAETDPFKKGRVPAPFIWGVRTGNSLFLPADIDGCISEDLEPVNYLEFTDTEAMIVFLAENEVIVYAHNGGKFDWHFVTTFIDDFEPLTIIAGRLAKFKIGLCEFRDSYNIIPSPLSAVQKDEIDYGLMEVTERHKPENWTKIRSYLKGDCNYLYDMVIAFIDEYGMNLTQAGAAMTVWSKMTGIKKPQSSEYYYEEMSRYYYGGRVECFEKGLIGDAFEVIDIKSAYPFAMMHKHPWGLNFSTFDELPEGIDDDTLGRCFITMDAASMGAFPTREKSGLTFHSDGEVREYHITGWEYLAARDTGTLANVKVKEVRQYFDDISFEEYVTHFFAMKAEAEAMMKSLGSAHKDYPYWVARRVFAKLFLNSLYGKYASNPANYQEFMTMPARMLDGATEDGWFFCKLLCEETAVVNKPLEEEKRRYYDVAVAASVTGFVRAYLWRNICKCEGVIYCDTDSIAARKTEGVNIANELGAWELEARCDRGAVAGKKLYAFHRTPGTFDPSKEKPWKTASKGVRLEAADIIAIATGETVVYEPEAPTFSIKRGIDFQARKIRMIA